MMKNFLALLSLVAVVAADAVLRDNPGQLATNSRPNYDDVTYYNCQGKGDGNYLHPFDCTRFITCHNNRAADMACGDCDLNNVYGCQGNPYLVYAPFKDWCDWPVQTSCHAQATTEAPETPAPETPTPTPAPETPEPETTASDTPAPTETPTPAPPANECQDDKPIGGSCDPAAVACDQCDWCVNKTSNYIWCRQSVPANPFEPITGEWVQDSCAHGQLINPSDKLATNLKGGLCTEWGHLPEDVKQDYLNEAKHPDCGLARDNCEYGQEEECSGDYWFIESTLRGSPKEDRTCPDDNIWDKATENCRPCEEVEGCEVRGGRCEPK